MEFFQVPGIFKDSICRAKEEKNGVYTISLNAVKIGSIVKENGGWRLLEQLKEELSAENVQLIGQRIDERNH
ncbi:MULTISPECIES: hypothetical protein [Pedobacter]|uniref:Uncharacterized protein n=2 Tax=Pedobacter TaxID=84567 RepID=A0A7K0FKQ1_9SPHI|nr:MULTISPECIES: hypothetical protein [Pedobacter]MRX46564.1 hypothetical protein [Pedobacter puniceum]QEK51253.1 hypothetical protein FYC62_05885 [Pedobacter aquae]